jgi:histidinol phosphatase-like enzyme (inositol monophosphatase family)
MSNESPGVEERYEFAQRVAREAGALSLDFFRTSIQVERKADDSPVTAADRAVEEFLRKQISVVYSEDRIVGEEFPPKSGASDYTWVLDPIDGTQSFIHGVPLYGTLVGVIQSGRPVMGVIEIPALGERASALIGHGAWYECLGRERQPARVSTRAQLAECLVVTSDVRGFTARGAREAYRQLERAAGLVRTWGDCYGYLLVATGRADCMIDPILNLWDAAAVAPILREAGGQFTDWNGRHTVEAEEGIGTNGCVQDQVLAITRSFARASSGPTTSPEDA